jgi:SAM-dependent methyltransferase
MPVNNKHAKEMHSMRCKGTRNTFLTLAILMLAFALPGTVCSQQYQPTVGQPGKDVIWVPTPEELIVQMLDMAKVTEKDILFDLGSGDGRIVIAAAKRGARATGIEYNPDMVALSKANALKEGVSAKASFVNGDIFETDFSQATVITMYLLPDLNLKLRPKILDMKPGTRVVSHAFSMDDWDPDNTANVEGRTAYFWIVPAKVAGTWTWQSPSGPAELTLRQIFQKIEGTLAINGKSLPVKDAKLEGTKISFTAGDTPATTLDYSGNVTGNTIAGTSKAGAAPETKWTAERRITK